MGLKIFKEGGQWVFGVFGPLATALIETVGTAETLEFSVDIHNDESPAHLLVWGGSGQNQRLFDSEDAGLNLGNGNGTQWGIESEKSKILEIEKRVALSTN